MGMMASQITGVLIVYSNVCSDSDQRKHQSSASLAFTRELTENNVANNAEIFPVVDIFMCVRNTNMQFCDI